MPAQTRVPGAASSEVDFELERFVFSDPDRIEIAGRWFGLRGRRFMRPVLNLTTTSGTRRRAIALLEHKPWAAADGETWLAAFTWPEGAGDVERAELEVGPGLMVELPAPGAVTAGTGRVSAMRPPPRPASVVAVPEAPNGVEAPPRVPTAPPPPSATPRRDAINAAQEERDEANVARDRAEADRVTARSTSRSAASRRESASSRAGRMRESSARAASRSAAAWSRSRATVSASCIIRLRSA